MRHDWSQRSEYEGEINIAIKITFFEDADITGDVINDPERRAGAPRAASSRAPIAQYHLTDPKGIRTLTLGEKRIVPHVTGSLSLFAGRSSPETYLRRA